MKCLLLSFSLTVCSLANAVAQGTIGGLLAADTTLDLAQSPWTVDATLDVPAGVTLTIEAGVRVEFDDGTGIDVDGGTLRAAGTEAAPIVFGRAAEADHEWDGFRFENTMEDNLLAHFSMEYGDDRGESITVDEARLTIQHGAWPTTEETMIEMDLPAVIIEDSAIPGISGGEVIHGNDLEAPGYLILRRNTFGKASNGGDVIDFTGAEAPGPVLQVIDNVFMGGDDDGLDLDGTDAFISGNVFMDFRKDPANTRATTSNAVATGLPQSGAPNRTRVTMVRNLFINCDHAVLLKEEAFLTAVNNTFVGMQEAAIQFDEVGGTSVQGPGRGASLDGNIFWDNNQLFKNQSAETELTIDRCLIDAAVHDRGVGNLSSDPGFSDAAGEDYSLISGSPAIGTGPNGLDMGYLVPAGASISGEPPTTTWRSDATLTVDGPAIVNYRFRLNGGAWSADTPVGDPIVLSGLSGANSVEVVGQNTIGEWQADGDATMSNSWTVDPGLFRIWLNEIDATNGTVEIWNNSANPQDLNGFAVNGTVIAGAAVVPAGGYLSVAIAGLRDNGGIVTLSLDGDQIFDSVAYGIQIPGSTTARLGRDSQWGLAKPTPGAENVRQPTALRRTLRLNEWLLNPDCLFRSGFVEIYNPEGLPMVLDGLVIDIEPTGFGSPWIAIPHSFIAAQGFLDVILDGELAAGADHSNLDPTGDFGSEIRIVEGGSNLDYVVNNSGDADISGGRIVPGGDEFDTFDLPTPGFAVTVNEVETVTPLIGIADLWGYQDTDIDLGTTWREPGFDDGTWPVGSGLLGRETSLDELPEDLLTEVNYVQGIPTYYFRRGFTFVGDPAEVTLRLRTVLDDGAVIYLNGTELHRLRMDDPVSHDSFASENVGNADYEGPFEFPVATLVDGENVIAVEVHQDDENSSDIVFGLELEAVETMFVSEGIGDGQKILDGLRLTEIMYHPSGDPDNEFLELLNTGESAFDLGGLRFVEGIEFEFPPMMLEPGEFVYVVKDAGLFGRPDLNVAGEYLGDLDDDGERLRLELDFGAAVVDETYLDSALSGADGGGNSLELARDGGLKNGRWLASSTVGGTLGALSEFEGYGDWASRSFSSVELEDETISGPDADPDCDGLANLLEWAFGSDPKVVDRDGAPDFEFEGGELVLRYSRFLGAGEVDLSVESSGDLATWTEVGGGLSGEIVGTDLGVQVIELRIPVDGARRKHLRLRAELVEFD